MFDNINFFNDYILRNYSSDKLSLGFYDGSMGIAIVSAILSSQNNYSFYKEIQDLNIKRIVTLSLFFEATNFQIGISGIGWGLDWLANNKYIDIGNKDDFFEDFDDILYRELIYSRLKDKTLLNGNLGLLKYFTERCKKKNNSIFRQRKIINQECLYLIESDISNYIAAKKKITYQEILLDKDFIISLADIIRLYTPLYNRLAPTEDSFIINILIYANSILKFYESNVAFFIDEPLELQLSILYLAVVSLKLANSINNHNNCIEFEIFINNLSKRLMSQEECLLSNNMHWTLMGIFCILSDSALYNGNFNFLKLFLSKIKMIDLKTSSIHNLLIYILSTMIVSSKGISLQNYSDLIVIKL